MTICIGAIADGNKIIAITDKMLTLANPLLTTKYEISENNKAIPLNSKVCGLFAGDVIQGNEILAKVRTELLKGESFGQETIPEVEKHHEVEQIALLTKEAYANQWKKVIEENLLSRYGMTIDVFMANHNRLDPDLVKKINNILGEYNLGVEIIIVGIDVEPHIYLITNPGVITKFDSIAYTCIGSGSQHATLSLIESEYNRGISIGEGLYALLEAKKRAEFDPGVGQLCDIVIVDQTVRTIKQETVKRAINTKYLKNSHEWSDYIIVTIL